MVHGARNVPILKNVHFLSSILKLVGYTINRNPKEGNMDTNGDVLEFKDKQGKVTFIQRGTELYKIVDGKEVLVNEEEEVKHTDETKSK
jgi:hypothetical protein